MLSELCKKIIDNYQDNLPLCERPFLKIAEELNTTEDEVIIALQYLNDQKILSRLGVVFNHNTVGASTLAAVAVPDSDLSRISKIVSNYKQVNHNYLRDNPVNLWFVLTAESQSALMQTIISIEKETRLQVMSFPMESSYHIDLGFKLDWSDVNSSTQQVNVL